MLKKGLFVGVCSLGIVVTGCFSEEVSETQSDRVKTLETIAVKGPWRFELQDLSIDGKLIFEYTFEEFKNLWGEPTKIESYKQPYGGSPDTFMDIKVVHFPGIEIEFRTENTDGEVTDDLKLFRFDLTGPEVVLDCSLQTGMSVEEVKERYEIEEIVSKEEAYYDVYHYKPEECYEDWTEAIYIYQKTQDTDPFGVGLILLIKEGTVQRITMNYPGAG